MVKSINICVSALASGLLVLGLVGCQKTDGTAENTPSEQGPAEKVGQQLDQAAAEAAKHLNTMAEHAGKGLEKAGESLQNDAKDGQEKNAQSTDSPQKDAPAAEQQE